jgi:hypothetical protein
MAAGQAQFKTRAMQTSFMTRALKEFLKNMQQF